LSRSFQLRNKSYQFFANISIPGIPSLFRTERMLYRLIWAILIILSFTAGFYNIADLKNDFFKYEVISNVERLTPENFTFPPISICTGGYYKRSYFKNNTLINSTAGVLNNNISLKNFLLRSEFYNYKQVQSEIHTRWGIGMGKCIRINGPKNKNTDLIRFKTSEEVWRGLWVDILPEYRQNISGDEYFTYGIGAFDVDIGDNGYGVSYYSFYKNEYSIKITKTEIEEKLGEPYNTCRQSTEDEIYNQADCIEKCVNTELANKYNCTWYGYNEIEGLEYCKIPSIRTEFKMKCRGECPKNCETMKFITELTRGDETNLNYTKFHFFMTEFSSLRVTQIPKTNEWSFISNIGGALGLFMGISFLSFIEIFAYVLDILSILFNF
jgi:hypothetical protein